MKRGLFTFVLLFLMTSAVQAVEPTSEELQTARDWSAPFWSVAESRPIKQIPEVRIDAHQKGVSVKYRVNTARNGSSPINIAGKEYAKGFFIHANATLEIVLPENAIPTPLKAGRNEVQDTTDLQRHSGKKSKNFNRRQYKKFSALLGLEKNDATKNGQGSVQYIVRQGKKDLFISPVIRGGQPAVPVDVPIAGTEPIQILVTDSGDGISCDHGTLADLKLTCSDGSTLNVSDLPLGNNSLDNEIYPFSFEYNGVSSRSFLKNWKKEIRSEDLNDGRIVRTLTFTDPENLLLVTCRFVEYTDFPTLEWTLHFKNISSKKSPIISNIRSLDKTFLPNANQCVLHFANGSDCMIDDFQQFQTLLRDGEIHEFKAANGRGTDAVWPYYNIEAGNRGVIAVIGWPGQWKSTFSGKMHGFHLAAGQEETHFSLTPGEEVRTPLSVVQFWNRANWVDAQNIWRQWMIRYNVPKHNGKLETSILSAASSYWYDVMGTATDESQIFFIKRYLEEKIPIDYWWMDAGWYQCDGHWPHTGTWEIDRKRFPNGLKKVTDFARSKGIKNIVWFEPERVFGKSILAQERQEWLLGKHSPNGNQLLYLGNPAARNWCIDTIDRYIKEEGIEFYRQDFNMPIDSFWRNNDAPDRKGITEIRHIEGYLAFWDEIRRRNPGVQIDTCSSGGRRLDLETLRRSVPLTCSDYFIEPTGAQMQTLNLSLWVPFHGKNMLILDDYHLRSFFMPFMRFGADMRPNAQYALGWHPQPHLAPKGNIRDFDSARRNVALWKQYVVPYYTEDFYPLNTAADAFQEATFGARRRSWTSPLLTPSFEDWAAWQFNAPLKGAGMLDPQIPEQASKSGSGIVQVFRRVQSNYESIQLKLFGLDNNSVYEMTDLDTGKKQLYTGEKLMNVGFSVRLEKKPDSALLSYRIADCRRTNAPADGPAPDKWNAAVKTIYYPSRADNTWQPALFYEPKKKEPVPLLVGLHPWSWDYRQPFLTGIFNEVQKRDWALICPDFRGPNRRPEACGSELAVEDIVSAVEYMKKRTAIDTNRIYLFGISGGGYATMLLAGRHPEIWGGASSWVGISDLAAWHRQTKLRGLDYSKALETVCGGAPGTSPDVDRQYEKRSAKTWLKNAREVPLSINAGIHDGHNSNSVPVSQSLLAFNILADPKDRIDQKLIDEMTELEKIPDELKKEQPIDPTFGSKKVLFRRTSGRVSVTIFDGGHEGILPAAFEWLALQKKNSTTSSASANPVQK